MPGTNKGGTRHVDGVKFTMTDARHSAGGPNGEYLGEPAGFVVEVENGTKLYFAGDTGVFGDMQLIGRLYEPDVAILPIGDHFTMGLKGGRRSRAAGRPALHPLPLRHLPAADRHA